MKEKKKFRTVFLKQTLQKYKSKLANNRHHQIVRIALILFPDHRKHSPFSSYIRIRQFQPNPASRYTHTYIYMHLLNIEGFLLRGPHKAACHGNSCSESRLFRSVAPAERICTLTVYMYTLSRAIPPLLSETCNTEESIRVIYTGPSCHSRCCCFFVWFCISYIIRARHVRA